MMNRRLLSFSRRLSRLAFYALLLIAPWALARVVQPHPVQGVLSEFSDILLYVSDVCLLVVVFAWLASHLLDPERPLSLSPWFVTVPLLLLLVLAFTSVPVAAAPLFGLDAALRLLGAVLLTLYVADQVIDNRTAALVLAAGMVLQAVLAVAQFQLQGNLGLGWLGEVEARVTEPGLWVRGFGLSRHPNILGGYLLLGLWATLGLAVTEPRRGWLLVFAAGCCGLLATFSRAAWLGLGVGATITALVLAWHSWRQRSPAPAARRWLPHACVGLLVIVAYTAVYPDLFYSRLAVPLLSRLGVGVSGTVTHVEVTNLNMRTGYVRVAQELIAAHPLRGVGSGNFSIASYVHNPTLPPEHAYLPVHNVLLLVSSELGLAGGAVWVLLWLAIGVTMLRVRPASSWVWVWGMALLGLFVTSLWDFYIWGWQSGRLFFFALLGLWASAWRAQRS